MIYYIVVIAILTILYLKTVYKKKNFVNLLFFLYLNLGLTMIFPYILTLYYRGDFVNIRLGDCYMIGYVLIVFIGAYFIENYTRGLKIKEKNSRFSRKNVCFIIAIIVFLFWIKNFNSLTLAISNPRMFYANSRINGGVIYYVIIPLTLFLYFCYITSLSFSLKHYRKDIVKASIATLLMVACVYIFGQKSSIITIALLYLSTLSFKLKIYNKNRVILLLGVLSACVFFVIFIFYNSQQNIPFTGLFKGIANFADYIDNFNDLVENLNEFYYGRIFLENETISYIPRFIWPGKPELYGSLRLGLNVPRLVEWTKSLTGAPSFGPIGTAYADFGIFGVLIFSLFQLIMIFIARGFEFKLKTYNFWYHILFLCFIGVLIFYVTLPAIPIYEILVVTFLYKCCSKTKRLSKGGVVYEIAN